GITSARSANRTSRPRSSRSCNRRRQNKLESPMGLLLSLLLLLFLLLFPLRSGEKKKSRSRSRNKGESNEGHRLPRLLVVDRIRNSGEEPILTWGAVEAVGDAAVALHG